MKAHQQGRPVRKTWTMKKAWMRTVSAMTTGMAAIPEK